MSKIDMITVLYNRTLKGLTSSGKTWTDFLKTAAFQYKYPFSDQVLIFAQRPGAIACVELEVWNQRFGRWVNKGAKGIALIREMKSRSILTHVFDVRDTHHRDEKPFVLWTVQPEMEKDILSVLENNFGSLETKVSLPEAVVSATDNICEYNSTDYLSNLAYYTNGSMLDDFDEVNLKVRFMPILKYSTAYSVLTRLGYRAEEYLDVGELDFLTEFNTPEVINVIGSATADLSKVCLREIEKTVRAYEKNKIRTFANRENVVYNTGTNEKTGGKQYENENRTDLQDSGRSDDSRPEITDTDESSVGQVRTDAAEVHTRTPQGLVHDTSDTSEAERISSRDRRNGEYADKGSDNEDGTGAWSNGSDESSGPDELDTDDEQYQGIGGGRSIELADIRISDDGEILSYLDKPQGNRQISVFEFENDEPVIELPIEKKVPLAFSQEVIDEFIRLGGCTKNSPERIYGYYRRADDVDENIRFLKSEYEEDYVGLILNGKKYATSWNEDGMTIAEGTKVEGAWKTFHLAWDAIEKRTRELIELGQYLPKEQSDKADEIFETFVADRLASLYFGGSFENIPKEYLSVNHSKGYPDYVQTFKDILSDSNKTAKLYDEILANEKRLEQYPPRFRYRDGWKPDFVGFLTKQFLKDSIEFKAADPNILPQLRFITEEKITFALKQHGDEGRLKIYSFFLCNKDSKKRIDFIKDMYGTGDGGNGRYYEKHDGKGLVIAYDIMAEKSESLLKWSEVAERYDTFIRQDKLLDEKDKTLLDWYERKQIASKIVSFYSDRDKDVQRPYEYISSEYYWDTVKKVSLQLEDPDRATEIYEMMREAYETEMPGTRNYEYHKAQLDDVKAFANGAFDLFPNSHFRNKAKPQPVSEEPNIAAEEIQEVMEKSEISDIDINGIGYDIQLGTWLYIGTKEVQVESMTNKGVRLYDGTLFPMEMSLERFLEMLRDNPLNDHLKTNAYAEQKNKENGTNDLSDEELDKLPISTVVNGEVKLFENADALLESEAKEIPIMQELPKPAPKITSLAFHPKIEDNERVDYKLKAEDMPMRIPSDKYDGNIRAIRVLHQLEEENRLATPSEQYVLARYSGWGGLADRFEEKHSDYAELKALLTPEEYTTARESTLTSFYTPPVVIEAMYKALSNMGFTRGNILEPSCGVGNFIGLLPESMEGSKVYGVELDSLSGRMARQLYQKQNIFIGGFEETVFPDSFFDVAIGNVPFGQFKVVDKKYDKYNFLIHDYFFAKALDKVRPGGVVAFITSKGTLDKENPAVRKYIAQRAELLGAIRLPDNAFKSAGTEVVSDIIFLQKRDRVIDTEPDWVHLGEDANGIVINQYFIDNPEMVLGEMMLRSGPFGPEPTCKPYEGQELGELLNEAISNIHAEIISVENSDIEEADESIPADPNVKNFSFTLVEGKVYYRQDSVMNKVETSITGENRIKGLIAIRDIVRALIDAQLNDEPDSIVTDLQAKLNTKYDEFTQKYGLINSRGNEMVFSDDSSYFLLCSLEMLNEDKELDRKADMFTKRTIKPFVKVDRVDTASEALAVSLSERAMVDMEYMSELTGKSENEIFDDLKGVIFLNPIYGFGNYREQKYVTADEYLSGNVREKLAKAIASAELYPEDYTVNVEALTAVQPKDLTDPEIGIKLGSTWVPDDIIEKFVFELLDTSYWATRSMQVKYVPQTAQWVISNKSYDSANVKANTVYGTERINAYEIIEQTLNLKDVRIIDYFEDANGKTQAVLNKKETTIAQGKQEEIKRAFENWVWNDPERREKLCKLYNEKFNSIRPREYDGSHIKYYGMNPEIKLRKHQTNAVARIMYGGNSLLAHVVGAGKTFTMVAAAQEMKRLGLCSKSMFVVPNHLIEQWASEYLQLYPSANILVATKKDFETKNRKKFCARIATGDYDAIIIGHSQFEKIPVSIFRQKRLLEEEIEEISDNIIDLKFKRGESITIKQLEKSKRQLETKLKRLNDQSRKDDVVCFEELGVDRIFVDEAHFYKNLFAYTKMRNVSGIAQTEAQKSSDLYMKCRYLDDITGGKGVIFATGTPISNTMVELYTMQRYLQYNELKLRGLSAFDSWASTFGETVTAIELAPDGSGYRAKTRFAKFYNIPELMAMFKQVADIQTADMLNLPVPKANYQIIKVPATDIQKKMVESFAERAERIHNKMVSSNEDNMLLVTNDGRKAALDQRLIDPLLPDEDCSKVNACAREVFKTWEEGKEGRLAQLLFCDLSTPKSDGKFNVYDDIKEKLVDMGVPREEIAFIHTADTDVRKKELFAKVRSGQVRILMGSTFKMGAGTNVQKLLKRLHDLDAPWRPSDLEQRSGRIVRQGNTNSEVEITRYVTEGTFDAYMYQTLETKQKFISQIMTSKAPVRSAEDVDETALSYAEIKALTSGNPKIIEKMKLDSDVAKLRLQRSAHNAQRFELEDRLRKSIPHDIKEMEGRIRCLEMDIGNAKTNTHLNDKNFAGVVIMGNAYGEKAEAGKAILEICKKITNPEPRPLGEYRGFKIELGYDTMQKQFVIYLCGKLRHSVMLGNDANGIFTRLDNSIENFNKRLDACRAELDNLLAQQANAEAEIAKPFPKEDELNAMQRRLDELNSELNMDKHENELADEGAEQCDNPKETESKQDSEIEERDGFDRDER